MQDIELSQEDQIELIRLTESDGLLMPMRRYGMRPSREHGLDLGISEGAKANRQRVTDGYCDVFYAQQARLCQAWKASELPPKELVLASVTHGVILQPSLKKLEMREVYGL